MPAGITPGFGQRFRLIVLQSVYVGIVCQWAGSARAATFSGISRFYRVFMD